MDKHSVYEKILSIAKRIARSKDGALFVITNPKKFEKTYDVLYPQLLTKHFLNEEGIEKVIEKLATLDGAVLIGENGEIVAYGAKIKRSKAIPGFGTKHAAAAGITDYIKDSTAILVSEEVNWIKVFQKGRIILEMDDEDAPRSLDEKIISFLSDGDTALLTAAGISTALLGPVAIAPLIVVGGTYLAIKTATGVIRKNWNEIIRRKKH